MRILTIFGTRPEAIKLAPVIKALEKDKSLKSYICVTAQHRSLLDQVLNLFQIKPDFDLNLMQPDQSLESLSARILVHLSTVLEEVKPDYILIQGDTTTVFIAALAAFYKKIKVAHLEAGLRTDDLYLPWPEEGNRRLTSVLSQVHFTPTYQAKENLIKENISSENVLVVGNTVIDALLETVDTIHKTPSLLQHLREEFPYLTNGKKNLLVTLHRRESHGEKISQICYMLKDLVKERGDTQVILSMHPNPNVQRSVQSILQNTPSIYLLQPPEYLPFVYLMQQSYLILTDSGGIQEEAPSLNVPVLVARDKTERFEGIEAGCNILVGTQASAIKEKISLFLEDSSLYKQHSGIPNPYGDGKTSQRIVNHFKQLALL